MNIKDGKRQDVGYILAAAIALLFCLYAITVSFGGIREAAAAELDESSHKLTLTTDTAEVTAVDAADFEVLDAADEVVESTVVVTVNEVGFDHEATTLKKTVLLLDSFGDEFGEVCFEAANEAVFMSYGWAGLAEKALSYTDKNKDLDSIKMELNSNCDNQVGESIFVDYNSTVIPKLQEDF